MTKEKSEKVEVVYFPKMCCGRPMATIRGVPFCTVCEGKRAVPHTEPTRDGHHPDEECCDECDKKRHRHDDDAHGLADECPDCLS